MERPRNEDCAIAREDELPGGQGGGEHAREAGGAVWCGDEGRCCGTDASEAPRAAEVMIC